MRIGVITEAPSQCTTRETHITKQIRHITKTPTELITIMVAVGVDTEGVLVRAGHGRFLFFVVSQKLGIGSPTQHLLTRK